MPQTNPLSNRVNHFSPFSGRYWSLGVPIRSGGENIADYSPFGVVPIAIGMDGRTVSLDNYRYSFQNQEKDDEIKGAGNSVNYTFITHDPRVGRFFSLDPLMFKYPKYSPYHFSSNQPIHAKELEGLESSAELDINNPNVNLMLKWSQEKNKGGTIFNNEYYNSCKIGQKSAIAVASAITIDIFITIGWMSRAFFLHELGSELNATDRYHEAKAKGDKLGAEKSKGDMKAHAPGATFGAIAELAPFTVAATLRYARESLAMKWMGSVSKTKYIDFNEQVHTTTYTEGAVLYQNRIPGISEGNYFVTSLETTPEQIGLLSSEYTEVYKITITIEKAKALVSTHIKKASYWRKPIETVEGGGK